MARALTIAALISLALLRPAGAQGPPVEPGPAPREEREDYLRHYGVLAEVVAQVELNYAEPVNRDRLFEAALRGLLSELDPYSVYLPPEEFQKLTDLAESSRPTTGLVLAIEQGRIVVLGVRPGSPAEEAGLRPGERLLSINGDPVEGMPLSRADHLLLDGGAAATLQLADDDGPGREVRLEARRAVEPTVVDVRRLVPGVGYLRIRSFTANTADEAAAAIARLKSERVTSLVIDLRFNPGGLLTAAVDVADLLLEGGVIVSVAPRQGSPRVLTANPGDAAGGVPVAVLVNRFSASASEVVAAALQDQGRAVVVGERTWGKGSVQSVIPLARGRGGLKLTTAYYRRPSGANIHRLPDVDDHAQWGVSPMTNDAITLTPEESKRLFAAWAAQGRAVDGDPQLELAIKRLGASENQTE